ncbi:hypothetical protein AN958_12161 [Leucoagaricus sp. SymC.cos]|nr:hypothetical protein AN958_12161 [Leucoagaricus sp. SymC.cos]
MLQTKIANVIATMDSYPNEDENRASGSTSIRPQIPRQVPATQVDNDLEVDERAPLLAGSIHEREDRAAAKVSGKRKGKGKGKEKKPFYRARPLWLVPFALVASLVRGMTLAPRVEVFTQLSCHRVYGIHHPVTRISNINGNGELSTHPHTTFITPFTSSKPILRLSTHAPDSPPVLGSLSIIDGGPIFAPSSPDDDTYDPDDSTSDPRSIPSHKCISDPDVQAGAARLQMIMTTTMGLLSALTTGWWGHFGERYGRTRVLAGATLGLFLTDLVFILVSTPGSQLSKHGHILLLIAPVIEGALGGWSTLQATTSAFTGVTNLGIFFGPTISGFLIQRSTGVGGTKNVTGVFWVAVVCSFINFLAAVFVFPESLDKEKQKKAQEDQEDESGESVGLVARLISPLAVFLPVMMRDKSGGGSGRMRRDWSLTVLASSFFCFMLCIGLYQLKYLYAEHVFGWGAEQLSWYISFLGGIRAIALLLILPYLIGVFKPKLVEGTSSNGSKPKPTRAQLGREISFDLTLTRCSFLMDIISNLLIIVSPVPAFRHTSVGGKHGGIGMGRSQAMFVIASGMASFGTGAAPAIHSLTLCILQAREMCSDADGQISSAEMRNVGGVFGAFAFLQSIGSMILGPMMFGLVYSSTVAVVPKAIFMVAVGTLSVSLVLMLLVRNPVQSNRAGKKRKQREEPERGRSML